MSASYVPPLTNILLESTNGILTNSPFPSLFFLFIHSFIHSIIQQLIIKGTLEAKIDRNKGRTRETPKFLTLDTGLKGKTYQDRKLKRGGTGLEGVPRSPRQPQEG